MQGKDIEALIKQLDKRMKSFKIDAINIGTLSQREHTKSIRKIINETENIYMSFMMDKDIGMDTTTEISKCFMDIADD